MGPRTFASVSLFIVCCSIIDTNYGLRIEINTDLSTNDVSILCLTDDEGGYDVKHIDVMQIQKSGVDKWLAYVSRNTDQFDTKPGSGVQVDGRVDSDDVTQNFLNLTFLEPKPSDSGTYTCVQYFTDRAGAFLQKKASSTLVVDDTTKLMLTLHQKITTLENLVQQQTKQECSCNDKIARLEQRIKKQGILIAKHDADTNSVEGRLNSLEEDCQIESEEMRNLTNKVTYSVAFSAGPIDNIKVEVGSPVVFDKPEMNQGGAYNPQNGVFTAPRNGLYAFQLSGHMGRGDRSRGEIRLALKVNAELRAGLFLDSENAAQGSVSDVFSLNEGDEVKVVTTSASTRDIDSLGLSLLAEHLTVFAGYLVRSY